MPGSRLRNRLLDFDQLVIAAILVLLWIGRLAWQGRFGWWAGPSGSAILMSLGILSLVFGVALLAGLVTLGAGITFKVRRSLAAQAGESAKSVVAAKLAPGESPGAK